MGEGGEVTGSQQAANVYVINSHQDPRKTKQTNNRAFKLRYSALIVHNANLQTTATLTELLVVDMLIAKTVQEIGTGQSTIRKRRVPDAGGGRGLGGYMSSMIDVPLVTGLDYVLFLPKFPEAMTYSPAPHIGIVKPNETVRFSTREQDRI